MPQRCLVPLFIMLIAAECLYGRLVMKQNLYTVGDTLGSLYSGIAQQWFSALVRLVAMPVYTKVYSEYRLTQEISGSATALLWFATAVAVEFTYYWFHRLSHEYQLLWQAHRVHHSGERYSLATALRQGGYQPLASFLLSAVPLEHGGGAHSGGHGHGAALRPRTHLFLSHVWSTGQD